MQNNYSRLISSFKEKTLAYPDSKAIVFLDNFITYKELDLISDEISNWILSYTKENWPICFCMDRSIEMIIMILWILKSWHPYSPIDSTYPEERIQLILNDIQPSLFVFDEKNKWVSILLSDNTKKKSYNEILAKSKESNKKYPNKKLNPNQEIYILFTSWSTWVPKWVIMEDIALWNLIEWQINISNQTIKHHITLQFAPIGFDVSFQEIFSTLCSWWTLVLITEEERKNPIRLSSYIAKYNITRLFIPFFWLDLFCNAAIGLKSDLKEIITAGEALKITPNIRKFFENHPDCKLFNQYGPTETHVTIYHELALQEVLWWSELPPIGKSIPNSIIELLWDDLIPVKDWEIGEIYIWGLVVAKWYLNQDKLTKEKFKYLKFPKEWLFYKTWDLAKKDLQWNYHYHWRNDKQIKTQWYRIEVWEIEATILQHQDISWAAVILHMDNEEQNYLVVFLKTQKAIDINYIKTFLIKKLPIYMIPQKFEIIDDFPLTNTGKINYIKLSEDYWKKNIISNNPVWSIDEIIEAQWIDILGNKTDVNTNFFEAWWNSLLATQFTKRLESILSIELSPILLFEHPTIEDLLDFFNDYKKD